MSEEGVAAFEAAWQIFVEVGGVLMGDQKSRKSMTMADYRAEAARRFGALENWRFVCPACGHVASVDDYLKAGASHGAIAFSCIGRWLPKPREAFGEGQGPCNYAGGGLFGLNPIDVVGEDGKVTAMFDFAEER